MVLPIYSKKQFANCHQFSECILLPTPCCYGGCWMSHEILCISGCGPWVARVKYSWRKLLFPQLLSSVYKACNDTKYTPVSYFAEKVI